MGDKLEKLTLEMDDSILQDADLMKGLAEDMRKEADRLEVKAHEVKHAQAIATQQEKLVGSAAWCIILQCVALSSLTRSPQEGRFRKEVLIDLRKRDLVR